MANNRNTRLLRMYLLIDPPKQLRVLKDYLYQFGLSSYRKYVFLFHFCGKKQLL